MPVELSLMPIASSWGQCQLSFARFGVGLGVSYVTGLAHKVDAGPPTAPTVWCASSTQCFSPTRPSAHGRSPTKNFDEH